MDARKEATKEAVASVQGVQPPEENPLEAARDLTVEVLLEMKGAYIRAGANPLKHMSQIQDRLRMAARTTSGVVEWSTEMISKLNLSAPGSNLSLAMSDLNEHVAETIGDAAWLDMVEREFGYLMAMTKLRHEEGRV